ncbi:hypothetical protein SBA3_1720008 [Candidatus Sulfopaludibacter sp. SbA3]|nr:hypothetical protein SBA3_1720008 [Candidatus Sulfopaludibacter sp. SbA3]
MLGTAPIAAVEIIKDGKFVYKAEPNSDTAEFDYSDNAAAKGQSWYYVRAVQADRNMAWSSPIWIAYSGQ